jgi:hypothetical protein
MPLLNPFDPPHGPERPGRGRQAPACRPSNVGPAQWFRRRPGGRNGRDSEESQLRPTHGMRRSPDRRRRMRPMANARVGRLWVEALVRESLLGGLRSGPRVAQLAPYLPNTHRSRIPPPGALAATVLRIIFGSIATWRRRAGSICRGGSRCPRSPQPLGQLQACVRRPTRSRLSTPMAWNSSGR